MNYYNEIKTKLLNNEAYERVKDYSKERHKVLTYFEIGRLLHEAGKHYGESIVQKYALSLEKDFGKKYNKRILFEMRQFYLLFSVPKVPSLKNISSKSPYTKGISEQKVPSLVSIDHKIASLNISTSDYPLFFTKLTWTHFKYLITIKNDYEREYYTDIAITNHLSVRELRDRIKSKEYYRLDESTRNKLIKFEETNIIDFVKNPIIINNKFKYSRISEKLLQTLILEDIPSF